MNICHRILPLLTLLFLVTTAGAEETTAFQSAQRHGEDRPGSSMYYTFDWKGKPVEIASTGQGTIGGKSFQFPLNGTRLTANLQYATYDGDLLLLAEETDEQSGAGKMVRFTNRKMKPKWDVSIPARNVGPGLLEGQYAYLSGRATAMKVDLKTGQWEWRKMNLNRTQENTANRFNAFGLPTVNDQSVTYPELPDATGAMGSIILDKSNGELMEVK